MSARTTQEVALTVLGAYGERDWDKAREALAPDCEIVEVPTGEVWKGPDGMVAEFERWAKGFSDSRSEFLHVFERGSFACVEAIWKGTHDGILALPDLELPPTGRSLAFPYCTVVEVRDGKQVRSKHYFDLETISSQLRAD